MHIQSPCVVALTWRLEDAQGQLIDELAQPVEFFYGGLDLLEQVEAAIRDQTIGFEASLHLEPEQAFGDYDASLVFFEERSVFPDGIEVGMQLEGVPQGAVTPDMPDDVLYTVTEVYPTHVVLDGNHPLAGRALRIHLKVQDVRVASADEIAAGTVGQPAFSVLNAMPPGPHLH
ncbi:MAG: peptidylprolyl isomerase [Burkholderiales bacterium PBB1]|nr:MAG: peptidylprolyl isomerase [Burkholderiales bacterium PBB1]